MKADTRAEMEDVPLSLPIGRPAVGEARQSRPSGSNWVSPSNSSSPSRPSARR